MRKRPITLTSVLAVVLAFAWSGDVEAQLGGNNLPPFATNYSPGPRVSPYLNLMRSTDSYGIVTPTYQALVRPQIESRRQARQQRSAINNLGRSLGQLQRQQQSGVVETTGHPVRFMTYSHYYPSLYRK